MCRSSCSSMTKLNYLVSEWVFLLFSNFIERVWIYQLFSIEYTFSAYFYWLSVCVLTAISTVVSIAEILKNNRFAVERSKTFFYVFSLWSFGAYNLSYFPGFVSVITYIALSPCKSVSWSQFYLCGAYYAEIRTLTVDMRDDPGARPFPKAKVNC